MELIRNIVKVGNSAGVVLPREWLNGKARIELVEKPINVKKDILEILENYLEDIIGIYLIGSYARGEQTDRSDIDVLVITNKTNENINQNKYHFILISKSNIEDALKTFILPVLPMLREAKPVVNADLIREYKKTKLTRNNLKFYFEITKSGVNLNKAFIEFDEDYESNCSDANAYSLILHIRSTYIVDCIIKNKIWDNKLFINLIEEIAGSSKAYEGYLRIKDNKKIREELPVKEAKKLQEYLQKKIKEHEEWIKRKD